MEKKKKGKPRAFQKGKLSKKKAFARNMKEQKKFLSEICGMERYIDLNAVLFVLQPPLLINRWV